MSDLQALMRSIDELTPDELKQLYLYIVEHRVQFTGEHQPTERRPRVLGLHAHLGQAWMSDDFRDELPDSFWLGEDKEPSTTPQRKLGACEAKVKPSVVQARR